MTETLAYGYSSESTWVRAIQWIPTGQGLDGLQRSLCPLDESSLSIGGVDCLHVGLAEDPPVLLHPTCKCCMREGFTVTHILHTQYMGEADPRHREKQLEMRATFYGARFRSPTLSLFVSLLADISYINNSTTCLLSLSIPLSPSLDNLSLRLPAAATAWLPSSGIWATPLPTIYPPSTTDYTADQLNSQ